MKRVLVLILLMYPACGIVNGDLSGSRELIPATDGDLAQVIGGYNDLVCVPNGGQLCTPPALMTVECVSGQKIVNGTVLLWGCDATISPEGADCHAVLVQPTKNDICQQHSGTNCNLGTTWCEKIETGGTAGATCQVPFFGINRPCLCKTLTTTFTIGTRDKC